MFGRNNGPGLILPKRLYRGDQLIKPPQYSLGDYEEVGPSGPSFDSFTFAAWDAASGGNASGNVPNAVSAVPLWVVDQNTTLTNWDGIFNDRELLIIDGSDAMANITSRSSVSVSFWYNWYTAGSNPSNGSPIIGHGNGWPGSGGVANGSFHFGSNYDGSIFMFVHDGYAASAFSSGSVLSRNTWHFITLTAGTGGWRVYVDGVIAIDMSWLTVRLPSINRVWAFGAYWILIENTQTSHTSGFSNHYDYYWAGVMGDIRMHNKTLSAAEVAALYAAGRQSY